MSIQADRSLSPQLWGETLSGSPEIDVRVRAAIPALIRRWKDIAPVIDQPSLDQHYVSLHLAGPKRVHRSGDGRTLSRDVGSSAYSVAPAGSTFGWRTEGPIDFVHVYLDPRNVDQVVAAEFDRDPRGVALQDALGAQDPLIEPLILALLREVSMNGGPDRAYIDALMHMLVLHLLRLHTNLRFEGARLRLALAPHRLRRALDYIEAMIAEPIGLTEIAAAAGVSSYHFCRGFRQATGATPYAYLIERRVVRARSLLTKSDLPLAEIALRCGFASHSQFSRAFKRHGGVSPHRYRGER